MLLPKAFSVHEIAQIAGIPYQGNPQAEIRGINEIHKVQPGDLTFVDAPKHYQRVLNSAATAIIIDREMEPPPGKVLLFSSDPFRHYNDLCLRFRPPTFQEERIAPDAEIGEHCKIYPGVVIGNNVRIGRECIIYPNTVIYDNTRIGDHVIIHANVVIGSDAFYVKSRENEEGKTWYEKFHSVGRVVIEDWVEIGSGSTIDRGVSGDTIIGRGTKLDNLVHIGHGVEIGENCLFAAQVGIGGKTIIGDNVVLWGQVGVSKSLTIGDGAVVYAQSGVKSSIEGGKTYFGSPVMEAREKMKELAWLKRLPQMWNMLREKKA